MKLGQELHFSSEYLYNGYVEFIDIDKIQFTENALIMNFINFSMGIERMMKVLLLLSNEMKFGDNHIIEDTLKENRGHDLSNLNYKIKEQTGVKFTSEESLTLTMISEIYTKGRYSNIELKKEMGEKITGINKKLDRIGIGRIVDTKIGGLEFPKRTKESIFEYLDSVINTLTTFITEYSKKLNIYTYETESHTKLFIFNYNKKTSEYFYRRKLVIKELFYYLAYKNKIEFNPEFDYQPLKLDEALISDYISSLIKRDTLSDLISEVESEYIELYDDLLVGCESMEDKIVRIVKKQEQVNDDISKRIYHMYHIPIKYMFEDENFLQY